MSIRVMLVDDHKILRDALKGVLEREHDMVLVGEAGDGVEALAVARAVQPDVVLMDIGLPALGGIETTRALISEHPKVLVIALSTFSDRRILLQMLDAGASGYVVKPFTAATLDEKLKKIFQTTSKAGAPA